jgi:hypothetical protein
VPVPAAEAWLIKLAIKHVEELNGKHRWTPYWSGLI